MIDFEAVRRAYHSPPPANDHLPTIEERIAAFERQRVEDARRRGIDPRVAGMGEHGSLIGGPDKPPTRFEGGRRAEDMVRMPPMPLSWFDHDNARRRAPCHEPHRYLDVLSADHLAGYHLRPDGRALRRLLRADRLTERQAHLVEQFLARLRMIEIANLLSRAGLTIYEIARAMHLSGSTVFHGSTPPATGKCRHFLPRQRSGKLPRLKAPAKTHWINQFAARPE